MSLKQKRILGLGVLALGVLLAIAGASEPSLAVLKWLGVGLILAELAADVVWSRCPHCGVWLGRHPGTHCRACGKEIDYTAKK